MIRILLLEDSQSAVEALQIHLKGLKDLGQLVAHYPSVADFKNALKNQTISMNSFDVLFLDIELEGSVSGYDFLRSENTFNKPVVCISSYPKKYAHKGYEYKIERFLPKPIGPKELKECLLHLSKIATTLTSHSDKFPLKVGCKTYFLNLNEVILFEADGNEQVMYTIHKPPRNINSGGIKQGAERFRITMKELESLLPSNIFQKIGKSLLINVNFIYTLDKEKEVVLKYPNQEMYVIGLADKTLKDNFLNGVKGIFGLK
jgi:DNA-binding LytR/AlgR family response regulator